MEAYHDLVVTSAGQNPSPSNNEVRNKIFGVISEMYPLSDPFMQALPVEWDAMYQDLSILSKEFPDRIIQIQLTSIDTPSGAAQVDFQNGTYQWRDYFLEGSKTQDAIDKSKFKADFEKVNKDFEVELKKILHHTEAKNLTRVEFLVRRCFEMGKAHAYLQLEIVNQKSE